MENEKKEKVEVQKNSSSVDDVKCDYEGIKIIVDKNFIPKSLLSREDIKKFNYVLINLVAKFTNKANSQRDAISFKVYPLVAKNGNIRNYSGFKTNEFSELYRLNDDRQVSLIRNDLTSILLAMGKTPVIENMSIDTYKEFKYMFAYDFYKIIQPTPLQTSGFTAFYEKRCLYNSFVYAPFRIVNDKVLEEVKYYDTDKLKELVLDTARYLSICSKFSYINPEIIIR